MPNMGSHSNGNVFGTNLKPFVGGAINAGGGIESQTSQIMKLIALDDAAADSQKVGQSSTQKFDVVDGVKMHLYPKLCQSL